VAGVNPSAAADGAPLLRLPGGPRALGDAVLAWLSPTTPVSAAQCTVRGSAPCSFAGLDVGPYVEWARKLQWLKRPDASMLDDGEAADPAGARPAAASAKAGSRKSGGKRKSKRR